MADERGNIRNRVSLVARFVGIGLMIAGITLSIFGAFGAYPWSILLPALLWTALALLIVGGVYAWRSYGAQPTAMLGMISGLLVGAALSLPIIGTRSLWGFRWPIVVTTIVVMAFTTGFLTSTVRREKRKAEQLEAEKREAQQREAHARREQRRAQAQRQQRKSQGRKRSR